MMFYKSLFSLTMVFAAMSSVAASTIPARRGGGGLPVYHPAPLSPISASQCDQKNIRCCNTVTPQSNPQINTLFGNGGLPNSLNPNMDAGLSCNSILSSQTCSNQALCCEHTSQNGMVNFNCVPVNLNM